MASEERGLPLVWFLFAWLILIGLFALATLITLAMNLKYGITGFGTYLSTGIFLIVAVVVLMVASGYLLSVDWTQSYNLYGESASIDF